MNLQLTDVVKNLLIINVLVFIGTATLMGDGRIALAMFYPFGPNFEPYQLVTHFFMHGSIGHLFFNMLTLFFFGPALESYLGSKNFLIFYFVCAAGAALLHVGVQYYEYNYMGNMSIPISSAWGASGAIYGILVGFAMKFPQAKMGLLFIPIAIPAPIFVTLLIAYDLFAGFGSFNTGIAHFAHLGGALAAFLLIKFWEKNGNASRWQN